MAKQSVAAHASAHMPVIGVVSLGGYQVEILVDKTQRRTLYRAQLRALPGCGTSGKTPTLAVKRLGDVYEKFLQNRRGRGERVPPPDTLVVTNGPTPTTITSVEYDAAEVGWEKNGTPTSSALRISLKKAGGQQINC